MDLKPDTKLAINCMAEKSTTGHASLEEAKKLVQLKRDLIYPKTSCIYFKPPKVSPVI